MEDIAGDAGVGVATLYRRWPDKPALADALLDHVLSEFSAMFEPVSAPTAKQRFVAVIERLWKFADDDHARFIFLEGSVHAPYISEATAAHKGALTESGGELLATIGVGADRAVAHAMVIGTVTALLRAGETVDPSELAQRLWSALRA